MRVFEVFVGRLDRLYGLSKNGYSGPFFVSFTLLSMGVWVLLVPDVFGSSPVYDVMGDLASEAAWGVFMIATSIQMLFASLRLRPRTVAGGALLAALGFFMLFSSVVAGSSKSMWTPLLFVLVLWCLAMNREFIRRANEPINEEGHCDTCGHPLTNEEGGR